MPTLDWLNRDAAFKIANEVPYKLLEAASEHRAADAVVSKLSALSAVSGQGAEQATLAFDAEVTDPVPAATHDNLLIQGDNLEALKAQLPFYRGQVKCVFIDPPYNTKNAFEQYDDNLEHAQWLSLMQRYADKTGALV